MASAASAPRTAGPWERPPTAPPIQTLIEQWNGISWAIVPSPNTSATLGNELEGVSSASAPRTAGAVGSATAPAPAAETLIEQWNGAGWAIVPSPNTSATQNNGPRRRQLR